MANEAFTLGLTPEAVDHLAVIRKWTMFLSILGFIMSGFLILMGLGMGFLMNLAPEANRLGGVAGALIGLLYIVIAIVYFFPFLFLFRFSKMAKQCLLSSSSPGLAIAFKNLRSHYIFMGILAIIGLACIPLGIVAAIVVAVLQHAG